MNVLCGCYYHLVSTDYYIRRQRHYLPLVSSEVHSTILSTTSRTVLKQTFTNPSQTEAISQCIYTFPLFDGVSVVRFTCRIGDKVLRGLVKEKAKAKEAFDQAVARGETAGLLEQAVEASDVFTTKLGNIPAGGSVIVEITYVGELKHHDTDGIRFTIPTKIAPRYGAGPSTASSIFSSPANDSDGIKIVVDVNMPEGSFIKGVQSPSHPIAVSMGAVSTASNADPTMSKASATLSLGSTALDKDFVLIVQSKDVGIPKAILEIHPTIPNHRAIMATLVPKFSLPPSRPEIVFVADRSGSMAGNIESLVSAMNVFIKSMPTGVKFNICSFGSSHRFLWKKSKSYSQETLDEATNHLKTFAADMGGTETFAAVKATIERRFTDIPLEIMLLTDGDIWRQEELFTYLNQQVEQSKGNIRVFPLGIGNGVSHALIEGVARAGNGFAQAVQLGERLDSAVVRMLRGALSPHITDYTLEVKYEKENDDFELVDRVTEGMKVLLSSDDVPKKSSPVKAVISLFDTSVDPEKDNIKNLTVDLPKIPTPKLLQAPHKIPSLFAFSRTTVYLLMSPDTVQRNPTAVILHATSTHGPLALEIPIEALPQPAETIHQLAAKKAVQDLEEGRGWLYDAKTQKGTLVKNKYPSCFDDLVKQEAVRLGEKFQVAGRWCSFVAVADNDKEIEEKKRVVPTPLSADGEAAMDFGSADSGDVLYDFDFDSFLEQGDASQVPISASFGAPPLAKKAKGGFGTSLFRRAPSQPEQRGFGAAPPNFSASQPVGGMSSFGLASHSAAPAARSGGLFGANPGALQAQPTGYAATASSGFGSNVPAPGVLFGNAGPQNYYQSSSTSGGLFGAAPPPPPIAQQQLQAQQLMQQQQQQPSPMSPFGAAPSRPQHNAAPGGLFGASVSQDLGVQNRMVSSIASKSSVDRGSRSGRGRGGGEGVRSRMSLSSRRSSGSSSASASSPVGTKNWTTASTADKVHALISLQDFSGAWSTVLKDGGAVLPFSIHEAPKGAEANVWITLLVVKFLEEKCKDEEGVWALVVEKARGWLEGEGIMDLDGLEAKAGEIVLGN